MQRILLLCGLCLLCLSASSHAQSYQKVEQTVRLFLFGRQTPLASLQKILWQGPLPVKVLKHKTYLQLRRLRNTIFAVKLVRFRSSDLTGFYKKQRWYLPLRSAGAVRLSDWAKKNLELIRSHEQRAKKTQLKTMRKRVMGPVAKVGLKGASKCYDFPKYRVVVTPAAIRVGRRVKGAFCELPRGKVLYVGSGEDSFDGIVSGLLVLTRGMGSDYFSLTIRSLATRKVVFRKKILPPNANLSYDKATRKLTFYNTFKMPASCKTKDFSKVGATLRACWPAVQKEHRALRSVAFPKGCACRGLSPYISVLYTWDPKAPKKPAEMGAKAVCGCSS